MSGQRLFFELNRAQHLLAKRVDAELARALGIRTAQLGAVFFLLGNDGCMLKDLGAGLGLNNSAITTLVARMEEAGLVRRVPCSIDGRSSRLSLTEKARAIGRKAVPMAKDLNARMAQGFSEREIETVIRFLDGLVDLAHRPWASEADHDRGTITSSGSTHKPNRRGP